MRYLCHVKQHNFNYITILLITMRLQKSTIIIIMLSTILSHCYRSLDEYAQFVNVGWTRMKTKFLNRMGMLTIG